MIFPAKKCRDLVFICIVLSMIVSGNALAKGITFTFAPKDGLECTQKLTTIREKQLGEAGIQKDESVSTTKITYKKTKDGWDIIIQPIDATMKRNGQEINNPVIALLAKISTVYKLDKQGHIKDIVGYDKIIEILNSQFSPDVVKKIAPYFNAETMKQKAISEWNGRTGDYIGKTVSVGDVWEQDVPFTLPNGVNLGYKIKTLIKKQSSCANSKCLLIEQSYNSKAEGIADMINNVTGAVAPNGKNDETTMPKVTKKDPSIHGTVSRTIDPTTMNIFKEEVKRTIQLEMDAPGQGPIPVKMVESNTYEFEYK